MLEEKNLLTLAEANGFHAAVTAPDQVPVKADFRAFCEENLCGKYNANYSCPPDCGTVEELHQRILGEDVILVVQTQKENIDKTDKAVIGKLRAAHNASILRMMKEFQKLGYSGFCAGYGGCSLCEPCKRAENLPCAFPELRISCMSAYCIDVATLADRCHLDFSWEPNKLYLFGMFALHKN